MRELILRLVWLSTLGLLPAHADDKVVQEFSGSGSTTTGLVKVQDRWEIRWNARQVVSIAVMAADGTIVAGQAGVLRGSLFLPTGGQYYFKISDGTVAAPTSTNAVAITDPNTAAASQPPATTNSPAPIPPPSELSWHLQVLELGAPSASLPALTVYAPFFTVPDSALVPLAAKVPSTPAALTDDQARALVTLKGDTAQGTAFLVRSPDGVFVVTHLSLLAANPNLRIFTTEGSQLKMLALKGAADRDLALIAVQDEHLSALPFTTDAGADVAVGDPLIMPDLSGPTVSVAGRPGKVIGISPQRIDFDIATGPNASGAPVIHLKSGQVVAMATSSRLPDLSDTVARAWTAGSAAGPTGNRPYGLRLGGVSGWDAYNWSSFLVETTMLKQFHHDTRCLDSYLNGQRRRGRFAIGDQGAPDARYYMNSPQIHQATDTYKKQATDADRSQQLEAARELLFDLREFAHTGVDNLQQVNNLDTFDQGWAQEELAYRKALEKELDDFSDNLPHFDGLARSR